MSEEGRIAQVQKAYRDTATTLLALHRLFRAEKGGNHETLGIWRSLTELEAPVVVVRPGIVVGSYWPEGHTEAVASGRMAQCAASFARNRHREKLEESGIPVHEVGPEHEGPVLPLLSAGMV